jgi:hypothetical protein
MADQVLLYISAAQDLKREREILGRAVVEIPVTLGWRIVQSPVHGSLVDQDAIIHSDLHLLLLGGDIRAPVGFEWRIARQSGKRTELYLKQRIEHTPAAQAFIRHVEEIAEWKPFSSGADLRLQVLKLISNHILDRAGYYQLSPAEIDGMMTWQKELETAEVSTVEEQRGVTGESSVILSVERYVPSEGVLLKKPSEDQE